jgi:hypothetical protein
MNRLARFMRRSRADRWFLLEALALLCWARFLIRVVPFRWIAPHLGRPMAESPVDVGEAERRLALRIAWAVQAVARNVPLGFVCLPQAIAAKWMLRRRRLPSTLYLGLQRQEESKLTAHAWLRVGDKILTGRAESLDHTVIATFAEETPSA